MWWIVTLLLIVVIIYYVSMYNKDVKEGYNNLFYYDFSNSPLQWRDRCQLQGLIDEYDNPSSNFCYTGYYVPGNLNFSIY